MSLRERHEAEVSAFVGVCRRLSEKSYAVSSGGNLAWRLAEDVVVITPTKMHKGDVGADDVVFVSPGGERLEGGREPTGELPMYLAFFRERPDVRAIIHSHPPVVCAFAISAAARWLARPLFPEAVIEVGPVALVPYAEPLTEKLAERFLPLLKTHNAFLMENHGLVVMSGGGIR
jgi:L-fuculose-phosphate aldolase